MLILLIEDDEVDQIAFERVIKKTDHQYRIASTIKEAKRLLELEKFDVIVSDYMLADGTGLNIIEMHLPIPIVMTTGAGTQEIAIEALKEGVAEYLIKDIDREYLQRLPQILDRVYQEYKNTLMIATLVQAIETSSQGTFITDSQQKIIFVNQAFLQMFEMEGIIRIDQSETIVLQHLSDAAITTRQIDEFTEQIFFRRKDGSAFPCSVTTSIVNNKQEDPIAVIRLYRDVSSYVALEDKLRVKAENLARTQAELEQQELFAFVSTHDLQEPLHKIITFGNLFMADPTLNLNETGKFYVNNIVRSVEEMRLMIKQVRSYTQILTGKIELTPIDLNVTVGDVLTKLQDSINELHAVFHIDRLPVVLGDKKLLYKLLLNLIQNALVFRKEAIPPEITIRLRETQTTFHIEIEDNGIGFEEKYISKLFTPFQRLHNSKEYIGRGLGLAICKRILDRHSGTISAKSTFGQGSTFTVSLPKSEKIG